MGRGLGRGLKKARAATRKTRGPGKGRRVRPGSGHHPLDLEWGAKGWVTVRQAAVLAGMTEKLFRKQLASGGALSEGGDWRRVGEVQTGVIYVRRAAAEALRTASAPP